METKKITLPSGAVLEIGLADFADGKRLYQAWLEELKILKVDGDKEIDFNFLKDIICSGFASKQLDAAITACMKQVTYNTLKIDSETFKSREARGDYLVVLLEVFKENIEPFTKGLFAQYADILSKIKSSLALRPEMTPSFTNSESAKPGMREASKKQSA